MATVSSSTTRASRDRSARCRSRTGGGYARRWRGDAGCVGRRRRVPQHVPGCRWWWCLGGVVARVGCAWRRACRALRPGAASVSGSTAPTEILEQVGHPLSNHPDHMVILHVSAPQTAASLPSSAVVPLSLRPGAALLEQPRVGYPATTAEDVLDQLVNPPNERSIVDRFAQGSADRPVMRSFLHCALRISKGARAVRRARCSGRCHQGSVTAPAAVMNRQARNLDASLSDQLERLAKDHR
jgi:hypothetical protein